MDHEDDDPIERCAGCGIGISAGIDRGYAFGPTGVLCPACSTQRGGFYDAERDRWVVEPDVQDLPDERAPHP